MLVNMAIAKVHAAADIEGELSPYNACRNVKIISEKNYDKLQGEIHQCIGKIQIIPSNGFFIGSLQDSLEQTQLLSFSKLVAERYKKNLDINLTSLYEIANCFSNNAAKSTHKCIDKKEKIHHYLEESTAKLRGKIALVEVDWNKKDSVDPEISKISIVEILKTLTSSKIKNKLSESYDGIVTRGLSIDELNEAKRIVEKTRDKAEEEWKKRVSAMNESDIKDPVYYKSQHAAFMKKKLWDFHRTAEEDYSKILYNEMPILVYLSKGEWDTEKKYFTWRNDKTNMINDAILKIIENIKKEKAITKKSLLDNKLELSRIYERKEIEEVAPNGQKIKVQTWTLNFDKWVADIKRERDLASYIAFTPVVEEILSEHPEYCGVATGLSSHLKNKMIQNYAGVWVTMFPALAGIGMIGTGTAVVAGEAAAITGAEISSVLRIMLGMGFIKNSLVDLEKTEQSVFTKSGTSVKEKDIGDYTKIAEDENRVKINTLLHPLDYVGAGRTGKLFYLALKNKLIPNAGLVAIHISPGEKAKIVNQVLKDNIFNGRDPSHIELKTLDKLSEIAKAKGFLGSEKLTLDEQKELMDRYILLTKAAFTTSIKTKEDKFFLKEAEKLFLKLNTEAVVHWERGRFDSLLKVYRGMLEEIKKMPTEKLEKLHNSLEEQFAVFDRAFASAKIKDKTEQKNIIRCALGVKGITSAFDDINNVACR